jgi:Xaa-Pro aminopeptidase
MEWCKQKYPLHKYERLAPIMQCLRTVKSEIEIDLIREACNITEKGFRKILPRIKPGIMEYEIEAALIGEFTCHRSKGFAYDPIVASGANACVLHYLANNQPCQAEDTILLDVGAEYANYKADLTRVVPVSGRFTRRQRAVYEAVLRIMRQAQQLLVSGNNLITYHQQVGEVVAQELVDLGLLDRTDIKNQNDKHPAYKKYFMHGASHHIGLDTHDVGDVHRKFEPGMVLTIEPGIYIRDEGLGVRLENDFVIRREGLEDLMISIPIEVEEIEELMHAR